MVSHLVRMALLVEILFYFGMGAWLVRAHGWSVPVAMAAAIPTALGARLVFTFASYALG